jgi:hypothetical protein
MRGGRKGEFVMESKHFITALNFILAPEEEHCNRNCSSHQTRRKVSRKTIFIVDPDELVKLRKKKFRAKKFGRKNCRKGTNRASITNPLDFDMSKVTKRWREIFALKL